LFLQPISILDVVVMWGSVFFPPFSVFFRDLFCLGFAS
jgi:hypothetical protein